MKITVLGRDGGDGADVDVLVVAVPGDRVAEALARVAEALARVAGIAGKPAVDATNVHGLRGPGHESDAHLVRSLMGRACGRSESTA